MKTKTGIMTCALFFVSITVFSLGSSLNAATKNTTATAPKTTASSPGGIFGTGGVFGPKPKDDASPPKADKNTAQKTGDGKKPLFSNPFGKKPQEKAAAEHEKEAVVTHTEEIEYPAYDGYSDDYYSEPAVSLSLNGPSGYTGRATSTRLDPAEVKKPGAQVIAPHPDEMGGGEYRPAGNVRKTNQAPRLRQPTEGVSTQASESLTNRILTPSSGKLERAEAPEPATMQPMPGQVTASGLPLQRAPTPDDVMEAATQRQIGATASGEFSYAAQKTPVRTQQNPQAREFSPSDLPDLEPGTNITVTDPQQGFQSDYSSHIGSGFRSERPILEINTSGPSRIAVGTQVTYEVEIKNSGNFTAEDIMVNVKIPTWVEVVSVSGTAGKFDLKKVPNQEVSLGEWNLGDIQVLRQEKLTLILVSTAKRAFDLDVTWKSQQTSTQTSVTVEEPKLELELTGGRTAVMGRPESFTLKMQNTGNCVAEDVNVFVISEENSNYPAVAQSMGNLAPGEIRTHTIQYLAKKPGHAMFRVKVTTRSGTEATAEQAVDIQYSELAVSVAPIPPQYVGVESVYRLFITNRGSAVTEGAKMELTFPTDMELVYSQSHAYSQQGKIGWELGNISPGETREFQVTLRPTAHGHGTLKLSAESRYTAPISGDIPVQFLAIANLQMQLTVPEKPILVDDVGEYSLLVKNTGSEAVRDVKVHFFFPEELEPQKTAGATVAANGTVSFGEQALMPGESRIFVASALSLAPGKHSVMAQVKSDAKDIDLLEKKASLYR